MTDWNTYFRILKKKLWIVVVITLLFTTAASYYSLFKAKPLYEATTKLFVLTYQPNSTYPLDYDSIMASEALVTNYQELIKSRVITTAVIKKLNLTNITSKKLIENIDVELMPNTSMLNVTVRYDDPDVVADIANELSADFIARLNTLTKTPNISLVDKATVSEKPVYPRTKLFIAFGFLLGLMLSLGMILIFVYFDDTIGDLEDIERKTGLKVVGVLPDINKVRIG